MFHLNAKWNSSISFLSRYKAESESSLSGALVNEGKCITEVMNMSGWSAAKALTLFSPSHLDPQSEHCFEVSIQSTSQVSAAAVSSHSPVCGMCSGERRGFGSSRVGRGRGGGCSELQRLGTQVLMWEEMHKKSVLPKACVDVWRAISSRRIQYARLGDRDSMTVQPFCMDSLKPYPRPRVQLQ